MSKINFTESDNNYVVLDSYKINWEKVESINDVIEILKAMNLHIYDDGSERFSGIRHLLEKRD